MRFSRMVIQKDSDRYTFLQEGNDCTIIHDRLLSRGDTDMDYRKVTKEEGNQFYTNKLSQGFRRFRNDAEISWKATTGSSVWMDSGYFWIPIKSRAIRKKVS